MLAHMSIHLSVHMCVHMSMSIPIQMAAHARTVACIHRSKEARTPVPHEMPECTTLLTPALRPTQHVDIVPAFTFVACIGMAYVVMAMCKTTSTPHPKPYPSLPSLQNNQHLQTHTHIICVVKLAKLVKLVKLSSCQDCQPDQRLPDRHVVHRRQDPGTRQHAYQQPRHPPVQGRAPGRHM